MSRLESKDSWNYKDFWTLITPTSENTSNQNHPEQNEIQIMNIANVLAMIIDKLDTVIVKQIIIIWKL